MTREEYEMAHCIRRKMQERIKAKIESGEAVTYQDMAYIADIEKDLAKSAEHYIKAIHLQDNAADREF